MSGIRLFRLFGTQVELHPWWFFILLLIVAPHLMAGDVTTALIAAAIVVLVYTSVVAHEFAHLLTARHLYGIRCPRVLIHIFGGAAMLERIPFGSPECVIALAGPVFSATIAALVCGPFYYGLVEPNTAVLQAILTVGYINAILAFFNFLPIFPLDGGRLARGFLYMITDRIVKSTRIVVYGGWFVVLPAVVLSGILPITLWTIMLCVIVAMLGARELKLIEASYSR